MYTLPHQMEPLFPAHTGALEDLARELVAASAQLTGRLAPVILTEIEALLRVVNSYYSNLIEGHNTHPVDIERAMRRDYSSDPDQRDLQIESRIHIEVQERLAVRLQAEPKCAVTSVEMLCWLHREFYEALPERLRWVAGADGERVWVDAGQLRDRLVQVGVHLAPDAPTLPAFLQRFAQAYEPPLPSSSDNPEAANQATAMPTAMPTAMHGLRPLIAIAAAHHRLAWIHPFLDGNGRVVRLFTDAYFQRISLAGYGLWNVSRGLARRRNDYRQQLAAADLPRQHDLDGRGNLSERALTEFCRFFLEVCLDQAKYMNSVLSLPGLLERLEQYVALRNAGMVLGTDGQPASSLHLRVAPLLQALAVTGEVTRGAAFQAIGMSERTGRTILKELLAEGIILSRSEKGAIRLGFPSHTASYWLPDLYPSAR